jgi:RNA polymerase sigma-70 factor (ECF subfamily)
MSTTLSAALPYWCDGRDSAPDDLGPSGRAGFHVHAAATADDELAARVRAGDVLAFEAIFTRYAAALATFAYRYTRSIEQSRDVVQDVFVRVWETRDRFAQRGSVRGYLYAAVRNHALHDAAHASVEARAADTFLSVDAPPGLGIGTARVGESADADLLRAEVAAQVRAALAALPPRARLIAMMRWQDGLSRGDIAEALGISVGTVNKQLTLAARALRARLSPQAD